MNYYHSILSKLGFVARYELSLRRVHYKKMHNQFVRPWVSTHDSSMIYDTQSVNILEINQLLILLIIQQKRPNI